MVITVFSLEQPNTSLLEDAHFGERARRYSIGTVGHEMWDPELVSVRSHCEFAPPLEDLVYVSLLFEKRIY